MKTKIILSAVFLIFISSTGCRDREMNNARRLFSEKSFHKSRLAYKKVERESLFYGKRFKSLLGAAWGYYSDGHYSSTIETCNKLLRNYKETRLDDWIILLRGFSHFARHEYRPAAEDFKRVSGFEKTLFIEDAVFMEARAREEIGEYNTAIEKYKIFLEKYHTPIYYRDALYGLWTSYERIGMIEKTYETLRLYLKKIPGTAKNELYLVKSGDLAVELNRTEEAINHYRDFLSVAEKTDTVARVLYWLGSQYENRGMDETAFKNYKLIVKEFPGYKKNDRLHYWLAEYYIRGEKWQKALFHLNEIIKKIPLSNRYSQSLFLRASILEHLGDRRHALLDYAEYLATAPDGEYFNRAKERIDAIKKK